MDGGKAVSAEIENGLGDLMLSGGGNTEVEELSRPTVVTTGWKDLPTELLLRILSLAGDDRALVMATGVCTGWRDALGFGVTILSLSWCNNNMNELMQSLAPKFPKLQSLTLRQNRPQLEDSAVESVAENCHDLQDLDLSKSFLLTDRSLFAVAHGCQFLTKLNISGCSSFSDTALAYLASHCKNLKFLNLCGCVRAASDTALQAIAHHCNQLQQVNLGWCESVTDKGVVTLALGCPELQALDLCGCIQITDDSVIALANGCPRLRSLDLYYCQNITDRAMYSLANSSRDRTRRSRTWIHGISTDNNVGLASLNISQCTALTPPAVQAVCDSFPALHTCPERHSLIISGCLSLTSVHCVCAFQAHRAGRSVLSNHAY